MISCIYCNALCAHCEYNIRFLFKKENQNHEKITHPHPRGGVDALCADLLPHAGKRGPIQGNSGRKPRHGAAQVGDHGGRPVDPADFHVEDVIEDYDNESKRN